MRQVWPVVIVSSRYGGVYEDALWVAFNTWNVPDGVLGDDLTCASFFAGGYDGIIGKGNTPDYAVKDLEKQFRERGER